MIFADCLRWMIANGFSRVMWPNVMVGRCIALGKSEATATVLARVIARSDESVEPRLIAPPPAKHYFVEVDVNRAGCMGAWLFEYPRPMSLDADVHIALAPGTRVTDDRLGIDTPDTYRAPHYCFGLRGDKADVTEVNIPPDSGDSMDRQEGYLRERQTTVYVPNNGFSRLRASHFEGQDVGQEYVLTSHPGPLGVADDGWRELLLECVPADLDPFEIRPNAAPYREWSVPFKVLVETWVATAFIPRVSEDVSLADGPFNRAAVILETIMANGSKRHFEAALGADGTHVVRVSIVRDGRGPYCIVVNDWTFYACECTRGEDLCRLRHTCADRDDETLIAIAVDRYLAVHPDVAARVYR